MAGDEPAGERERHPMWQWLSQPKFARPRPGRAKAS